MCPPKYYTKKQNGQYLTKQTFFVAMMNRSVNGTIRPNENLKKSKTVFQLVSKIRSVLPLLWLVYNGQGLGLYGNCCCVRPAENDDKETKLLM